LGTERILSERHRETMGRGVQQLTSGEQGIGDVAEGVGAVAWSIPSVIAGAGGGAWNALTGGEGGFQEGYRDTFFGMHRFDTAGRRQWEAEEAREQAAQEGRQEAEREHPEADSDAEALMTFAGALDEATRALRGFRGAVEGREIDQADTEPAAGPAAEQADPDRASQRMKQRPGAGEVPTLAPGADLAPFAGITGGPFSTREPAAGGLTGNVASERAPIVASAAGGWWNVPEDEQPALLHRQEMVLPANLAQDLREQIERPAITADEAQEAAINVRVQIDPIRIEWPGGGTTVQPRATQQQDPFAGIRMNTPDRRPGGML
jgi:hypothetical protein